MTDSTCPHCNSVKPSTLSVSKTSAIAMGMLLGIGSVGSETKTKTPGDDTATEEQWSRYRGVWCSSGCRESIVFMRLGKIWSKGT